MTITAYGEKDFLVEVAQQVSWLTASFRLPAYGRVSFSDVLFISTTPGIYKAVPLPLREVEDTRDACWLPLFLGTVIARDYPTPKRGEEKGLELPFHLMTTVAGALYPMFHDGGIYLRGHSRLLFPVSSSSDGSIQWHLITSPTRRVGLSPDTIHKQSWHRIGDPDRLANASPTFLGYCRRVVVNLGTNMPVSHYRDIGFSNAHDEVHGPSLQAPSSLTWGTSGMGIFGASMTNPIVYGKALAQTVNGDNDDYLEVLDLAMNRPIVLYDDNNETQRGWMVPALSAILHLVHVWAAQKDGFDGDMPRAEVTWKAGEAARKVLTEK